MSISRHHELDITEMSHQRLFYNLQTSLIRLRTIDKLRLFNGVESDGQRKLDLISKGCKQLSISYYSETHIEHEFYHSPDYVYVWVLWKKYFPTSTFHIGSSFPSIAAVVPTSFGGTR